MAKKNKEFTGKPLVDVVESNETFEKEMFTIVNHNGEFLIALANNVVSREKFNTREEAEHYIDCKPWELIFNSCALMWQKLDEIKQQQNNK